VSMTAIFDRPLFFQIPCVPTVLSHDQKVIHFDVTWNLTQIRLARQITGTHRLHHRRGRRRGLEPRGSAVALS
jgi:hypothetical protein